MTPWVRRLIIANVVMFGLQNFVPGFDQQLVFVPVVSYTITHPWTLITYQYLHGGVLHILFNMLTLYWFGVRVEERLGSTSFITLYTLSGIGGALLSFMPPLAPVIGASGAIMGVLVAFAMYWPREQIYIYGILPLEAWMLVTIYIILDVGGIGGFGGPGIAHFAHLGGAAVGFLYLKARDFRSPRRSWQKKVGTTAPPKLFGDAERLRKWRESIRLDDLHPLNRAEVVRLLQKAQQHGVKSLTVDERATLDRFSIEQ
jgi:membrane associated rhomboid family serine protease